ncbi:AAA family ATPase [Micromonospora sp. NPDC051925]|uniref:AAA family ATPase n=1 Tax=Micromonospora sp. NPDC051925 TaxID=3364288 RepID=UPI0037CB2C96
MPLSTVGTGREDVTTTPWPVPQERRTLTVLFADIVGSTALTERLDPEDVRAVQFAYFDTVAGVLRRWQGTVEKYVGDAVMALFGARTSDGLDGYRAVRAALEIQAALDRRVLPGGVTLRVRVGVATGEAVVDLAAVRDGGHGMASGAVLTTAARIQEYAPAGGVVVCAATHRATAGLVDQHALAPATLTGKALPVDVWRVTRTTHPRPTRHHGPLIGRRREVATARDQLTRAAREHRPRWVALVGPDGIGRSRLLAELRHRLSEVDGTPVRWAVAHCPPYPERVFGPVAELLRDVAGLPATGPASTVRARLAALVDGLVAPGRAAATVAALAALLDAPDRAAVAGAAAARQVLLALAARRPVVVGVDDLDRAAPELVHFLHSLFAAATARGLPLAVLATHRPDLADPLPAPAHRCHRVELPPLGTIHTGRLLRRLLTRAGQPITSVSRLLPLVAGRPGYAVAYVDASASATGDGSASPTGDASARPSGDDRSVDPTGPTPTATAPGTAGRIMSYPLTGRTAEPALPESLRRRAAARLDRCDGPHRAVLMAAATLDAEFTASAVDGLLGWTPGRATDALRRLRADGLVQPGPHGGHVIADPALRRCAYDRLPRTVRAEFARRTEAVRPADAGHEGRWRRESWQETAPTGTVRHQDPRRPGTRYGDQRRGFTGPDGCRGAAGVGTAALPAPAAGGYGRLRAVSGIGPAGVARSVGPAGPVDGLGPARPAGSVGPAGPVDGLGPAGPAGSVRPAGPPPAGGVGRARGGPVPGGHPGPGGGHRRWPVDTGPRGTGAVVVPLPPRRTGVPPDHEPATGGRRRRGEGVPRPAVPLPARAA